MAADLFPPIQKGVEDGYCQIQDFGISLSSLS